MTEDRQKKRLFKLAADSYRQSDEKRWVAAYACGQVVGTYGEGGTRGLAADLNVSVDTVEDHAHGYWIYEKMCQYENGEYRKLVRAARRAPFIYFSHFRALYDAQNSYKLSDKQVIDLLMDIVQGEGTISSRGVDGHTRSRYGDTRGWDFYARRTQKELGQTLQQPDLPNIPEAIGNAYLMKCRVDGKTHRFTVVAANPQRAQNIAHKKLEEIIGKAKLKGLVWEGSPAGEVITDSKHLLSKTHDWLGDKA